jgi:hypothetical protein
VPLASFLWRATTNVSVVGGTILNAVFYLLFFVVVLSWSELTVALPLTALEYLFAAILSVMILKEAVPGLRGAGIILVIGGVVLIGVSERGPGRPGSRREALKGRDRVAPPKVDLPETVGGPAVPAARIQFLPEDRAWIAERIQEVLASGQLTLGRYGAEFERRFATLCGTKHAVAVNSGTSALEIILGALGVEGRDVLVPTGTFYR